MDPDNTDRGAGDLWGLTIDDLFIGSDAAASALYASVPGPFAVDLSTSVEPAAEVAQSLRDFEHLHIYQVTDWKDDRLVFRLRLGPISSELEADAILSIVQRDYPGATTVPVSDDDLRMIALVAASAKGQKSTASSHAGAPAAKTPATDGMAAVATPQAPKPLAIPTEGAGLAPAKAAVAKGPAASLTPAAPPAANAEVTPFDPDTTVVEETIDLASVFRDLASELLAPQARKPAAPAPQTASDQPASPPRVATAMPAALVVDRAPVAPAPKPAPPMVAATPVAPAPRPAPPMVAATPVAPAPKPAPRMVAATPVAPASEPAPPMVAAEPVSPTPQPAPTVAAPAAIAPVVKPALVPPVLSIDAVARPPRERADRWAARAATSSATRSAESSETTARPAVERRTPPILVAEKPTTEKRQHAAPMATPAPNPSAAITDRPAAAAPAHAAPTAMVAVAEKLPPAAPSRESPAPAPAPAPVPRAASEVAVAVAPPVMPMPSPTPRAVEPPRVSLRAIPAAPVKEPVSEVTLPAVVEAAPAPFSLALAAEVVNAASAADVAQAATTRPDRDDEFSLELLPDDFEVATGAGPASNVVESRAHPFAASLAAPSVMLELVPDEPAPAPADLEYELPAAASAPAAAKAASPAAKPSVQPAAAASAAPARNDSALTRASTPSIPAPKAAAAASAARAPAAPVKPAVATAANTPGRSSPPTVAVKPAPPVSSPKLVDKAAAPPVAAKPAPAAPAPKTADKPAVPAAAVKAPPPSVPVPASAAIPASKAAAPVAAKPAPPVAAPSARPAPGSSKPVAPKPAERAAAPAVASKQPTAAVAAQKVPTAAAGEADRPSAPVIDSTQTMRALIVPQDPAAPTEKLLVIQLVLSEEEIAPEAVPDLAIFKEYRLYSAVGHHDGKVLHALRLGFFSDEGPAEAVAGYLRSFFEAPVVTRISVEERERFANRRVSAKKGTGETGVHARIELASAPSAPSTSLADLSARANGAAKSGQRR